MTYYERIMSMDIDEMAEFIYGIIATTEEEVQRSLARQGYDGLLVREMPEIRIADNLRRLQMEVDDGNT